MANGRIHGFAYGSNMLTERMKDRVPSAELVGIGQLKGHRLRWHKISNDGSGKCDAEFTGVASDVVWGIVYELSSAEKPQLDKVEGLGYGYLEKCVDILVEGKAVSAWLYYANKKDPNLNPYDWYKAFVVEGARQNRLPPDYITVLDSVASKPDASEKRNTDAARILARK